MFQPVSTVGSNVTTSENSSAPMSGAFASLGSPSRSSVTVAIGVPALSSCGFRTWRFVAE